MANKMLCEKFAWLGKSFSCEGKLWSFDNKHHFPFSETAHFIIVVIVLLLRETIP